ncbi:TRM11 family SAM-dependent methyltransferase [Actinoplanes teichomyceticus]|uniref:Methyltransferase n=1 Tax=Actinoplanes teichomyceticus TaxID=1867 RepID=A0A561WBP9_ACTTI|nr:DNA methyltransferase [Actinoplanes teichomyceticus]TWG21263.1 DNA methylase [Actinoplanes teichomyceticus]GIF16724.1 hypothetical protein Ate01nite_67560 [Actinoplanes teichomyceticus]
MGVSSWHVLTGDDPEHTPPAAAGQCGWVSQIAPLITEFSHPGDLVLDPFCGWGTTLVAASITGRRGVGIEVSPERAAQATERLRRYPGQVVICTDARRPPVPDGSVDLIVTDLPYFGTALDADSAVRGQLYAVSDYEAYLAAVDEAFTALTATLRPGAYAVVAVQNRRLAGAFVPLAWDVGRLLGRHLTLGDERIHLYPRPIGGDDPMLTNRAHEYLLIAQRK